MHRPATKAGSVSAGAIIQSGVALVIAGIGAIAAGSYYAGPYAKFSGTLYILFYQYQLGTIMMVIAGILLYDAVARAIGRY